MSTNLAWGPLVSSGNPSRFPLHTAQSGPVAPPVLTGVPASIVVGQSAILQGIGFTGGTRVVLTDGFGVTVTLPITLISSTQLSVTIPSYWRIGPSSIAVTDGTTTSYSISVSLDPAPVPSPWLTGVMTPGRNTYMQFDLPETILGAPVYFKQRVGADIARPGAQNSQVSQDQYTNVQYWPALGAWTLRLKQTNIARLHEYDADVAAIIAIQDLQAILYNAQNAQTGMDQEYVFRAPSDLNGIADGGSLLQAAQADPFLVKKVAPPPATCSADIGTNYRFPSLDIPEDRIAESFSTYPVNQGFFLRWTCPGTTRHNPNRIWRFYFGQYAVSIDGDGFCRLYEQPAAPALPDGSVTWPLRHEWRYAEPSRVCSVAHSLAIWPCYDRLGARYIVFANGPQDAVGTALAVRNQQGHGNTTSQTIYAIDSGLRGTDPDLSPGYATREDIIRLDTRRDLRVKIQLSTLTWETDGTLTDLPDSMLTTVSGVTTTIAVDAYQPIGCSAVGSLFDADTGQPFIDGLSTKPYAQFQFSGTGQDTPILYAYSLYRPAITNTIAPGMFSSDVRSVRLDGFNGDPVTQTGTVQISDPMNRLPRLRTRGSFSARVATSYLPVEAPNSGPYDITLHRGYTIRPDNEKHGKPWPQSAYPDPDWRDFSLNLQGSWWRLKKRVETSAFRQYAFDRYAMPNENGIFPPWKVTDIIRDLIASAGFPPEQINIEDSPIRLWPGKSGAPDEYYIKPEANYSEVIIRLAKNYLGGFIIYDENAGANGQWRLYYGAQQGDTPLIKFVTSKPNAYVPDHILPAYQDGSGVPVIPVMSDPLQGHIVEPEFNLVYVCCPVPISNNQYEQQICNFLHNPKAFDLPGFPALADPNHPDYSPLGCIPLVIIDVTLAGDLTTKDGRQQTQAAVDLLANHLYDFSCHAQQCTNFRAPFVCVYDKAIGAYRRPRYQDSVSMDGASYIIKSCSLDYTSDNIQMAEYELIRPIFDAE